jgi:hypothetical protein
LQRKGGFKGFDLERRISRLGGAALFLFEPVFRRFFSVSLDYLAGFQIEFNGFSIPTDVPGKLALQSLIELGEQFVVSECLFLQSGQDRLLERFVFLLVDVSSGLTKGVFRQYFFFSHCFSVL